jgi:uncharacterized coiled-coil protein SlyX
MPDVTATSALLSAGSAVAALLSKGGWNYLKARLDDSTAVQTAQIQDETHFRGELWSAMTRMQERMDSLSAELADSRKQHIELLGEYAYLKAEHAALKREHDSLLVRYAALESRVNNPTAPIAPTTT